MRTKKLTTLFLFAVYAVVMAHSFIPHHHADAPSFLAPEEKGPAHFHVHGDHVGYGNSGQNHGHEEDENGGHSSHHFVHSADFGTSTVPQFLALKAPVPQPMFLFDILSPITVPVAQSLELSGMRPFWENPPPSGPGFHSVHLFRGPPCGLA